MPLQTPPARLSAYLLAASLIGTPYGASAAKWYAPDYATLQYAGNLGFVSVGLGKLYADGRLWAGLHYGIVPPVTSSETIHTLAAKASLTLAHIEKPAYAARPLYLGLAITYTLGEEYDTKNGKPWPEDYYPQTTFHFQPYVGAGIEKRLHGRFEAAGGFLEVGTLVEFLDHDLRSQDYLTLGDVLNVALGATLRFR